MVFSLLATFPHFSHTHDFSSFHFLSRDFSTFLSRSQGADKTFWCKRPPSMQHIEPNYWRNVSHSQDNCHIIDHNWNQPTNIRSLVSCHNCRGICPWFGRRDFQIPLCEVFLSTLVATFPLTCFTIFSPNNAHTHIGQSDYQGSAGKQHNGPSEVHRLGIRVGRYARQYVDV